MKKNMALSKYFFKKNLRDIISFSIILFIATILFSSAFILNKHISQDYDREFDRLNTASAFFIISNGAYEDRLVEDIRKMDGIQDVEIQRGIMLTVPVNMDGSIQEQNQLFYHIDHIPNISQREIIRETKAPVRFGIYLSNYTFIHSGLDLKDPYSFDIDHVPYTFYIKGVVNEMQYGNYTSSIIGEYLDNDAYEYLLQNHQDQEVVVISVVSEESDLAYWRISQYLSRQNMDVLVKNHEAQSKNQRLAISNIIILILVAFSSIMFMISLFVSKFKIEQTMQEEMANMGVLKALGYTSHEIIMASIFPYIMSGLLWTLLGIVASYFVLPLLSTVIEMQSGFRWNVTIDLFSNVVVLFINLSLITMFTLVASFKMKTLDPINAIRGLSETKVHQDHFEIEKTKGNIHFILMMKNFMNTKKQNILLGIVLFFMTIMSSFVGILFYNINMNPIHFINTLVEEHPSVVVSSIKDLRDDMKTLDHVKNVVYYDENATLNYQDHDYKTFVAENFDHLGNDLCYEGNNPVNDNEIAIGSKIKETYDLNIGDYVTLLKNGIENEYKVVGFVQSVNYSGEIIEITLNGYRKMDPSYSPKTMYVYLEDEDQAETFIDVIKDRYDQDLMSTMNYAQSLDSAMKMYVSLISVVCIGMIIIALLLIYLILYIVISSIITRRKRELGIFKAIGYENKMLVKQLVGGFIPSTIMATILGSIVSKIWMKPLYMMIFKAVGAYKISFEYPWMIFLMIGFLLMLSTIVIAMMLAKKIKKISVYTLIKD